MGGMERYYDGEVTPGVWHDYTNIYSGSLYNYRNTWVSWIHADDAPDNGQPQACLPTLWYTANLGNWFYHDTANGAYYNVEGIIGGIFISTTREDCSGEPVLVPNN